MQSSPVALGWILLEENDVQKLCPTWLAEYNTGWTLGCTSQTLPRELLGSLEPLPDLTDFPVTGTVGSSVDVNVECFERPRLMRRDCFAVFYLPADCPRGLKCCNPYCVLSHTIFEKMFHPLLYRTKVCERGDALCPRNHCSFLHTSQDDLEAANLWMIWETYWSGWRLHLDSISGLIRNMCQDKAEETRVLSALNTAQRVRFERATPTQQTFIQSETHRGDRDPFFVLRVANQPMNYLYGALILPRVMGECLAQAAQTGAAGLPAVLSKLSGLTILYNDVLHATRSRERRGVTAGSKRRQSAPADTPLDWRRRSSA